MQTINTEINKHTATIILNRPEVHNAFNELMLEELTHALKSFEENDEIRCVILKANGKNFSAGADLNWMQKVVSYSEEDNLRDSLKLADLMSTLYYLSKPTIAIAHGATFGGGIGLIACCDIAIATIDAHFCFSEVKIGLIPAVISPYIISSIGARAAQRYFLTAERFDAQTAKNLGLIHDVCSEENVVDTVNFFADIISNNSPLAVRAAKQLIHDINNRVITDALIFDSAERISAIRVSKEGQEGLNAFLQKRKASWVKT